MVNFVRAPKSMKCDDLYRCGLEEKNNQFLLNTKEIRMIYSLSLTRLVTRWGVNLISLVMLFFQLY